MDPGLVRSCSRFPVLRIVVLTAVTLMLGGWSTCSALFVSCQTSQPQITALLPATIPGDTDSTLLTVEGSDFRPASEIQWNGKSLQTKFVDSHHAQATVTQQTLASFGGSSGSTVGISVRSPELTTPMGCPIGGNSSVLFLVIN